MAKSGYQIVTIDTEALEIVSGEERVIARADLPADLQSLCDLLKNYSKPQKPVLCHILTEGTVYEAFALRDTQRITIQSDDGIILNCGYITESDSLSITVNVF